MIRCSPFHQNTARINGCFVCKKFCAYDVLFLKLELFRDVFAHFGTCSFFPFCTNYRFMLSFLYVYSFCAQFYSTCYEHISHCAFFGNKFWRKICQVFQRLLVHFCHIPEVHSDESECIESLKLVQNLLS